MAIFRDGRDNANNINSNGGDFDDLDDLDEDGGAEALARFFAESLGTKKTGWRPTSSSSQRPGSSSSAASGVSSRLGGLGGGEKEAAAVPRNLAKSLHYLEALTDLEIEDNGLRSLQFLVTEKQPGDAGVPAGASKALGRNVRG
jgi:hypothetical protein